MITETLTYMDGPQAVYFQSNVGMVNHKSGCNFRKVACAKRSLTCETQILDLPLDIINDFDVGYHQASTALALAVHVVGYHGSME